MPLAVSVPEEAIVHRIYEIRGERVLLDRDLADLFGVATKALKQAVRRNRERFPEDFMFEMTTTELESWREAHAGSEAVRRGLRYPPFCFTEQGVTMLACVLNSDTAIAMNVKIIRVFVRLKRSLRDRDELMARLRQIEERVAGQDEAIRLLFDSLKELVAEPNPPRRQIGYRRAGEPSGALDGRPAERPPAGGVACGVPAA